MNETISIINNRVSLRRYAPQNIKPEHEDQIISAARRAPTAGNLMLYSIINVRDIKLKQELVKTCDNHQFIAKAPLVLLFLADLQKWWDFFDASDVHEYCQNNHLEYITPKQSALFMACCDALIAAQNSVITAESLGIGSCYVGDIMGYCERHREMFKLPRWAFPVTLLCFGYYPNNFNRKLSRRYNKEFFLFEDEYKRLSGNDFEKHATMKGEKAKNLGQAKYLSYFFSDPRKEEIRSVAKYLKDWE